MWEPQLAGLPQGLPIAAPDLPGFGGSPSTGETTTMAACARRAVEALDEAGIERAVVCGLSIGGYVTFELWRRASERFLGMVLANTRAVADTPEGAVGRREQAGRLRSEGNFLANEPPILLAEDAPAELQERVRSLIADQSPEAIAAALLGMAERPDSTPDLPGIGQPTLVIHSTGDRLIPVEPARAMASAIPGARLEILEEVGHLTNLEAPDVFNRLLEEHLASCGLR